MDCLKHSLGLYLQEARNGKGLSLEEAAIETNIALKYIEALEKDEYGFFPAEMYVTGFLSTYLEMLELDKEFVLSMYHRAVNKEKEIPLEVLYAMNSSNHEAKKYLTWGMVIVPVMLLFVGLLMLFGRQFFVDKMYQESGVSSVSAVKQLKKPKSFSSKEIPIEISELSSAKEFSVGLTDRLVFMNDSVVENSIEFLGYGRSKKQIKFQLGQDKYTYKSGDVLNIDLKGDGNSLSLEVVHLDNKGVTISLSAQYVGVQKEQSEKFSIQPYLKSIRNETPLMTVSDTTVVNMKIVTTRPVWVGYQIDGKLEQQVLLDESKPAQISFVDGVRLLLANAGAVTIQLNDMTSTIRGGVSGESSQSIFYKKKDGSETRLYRAQLK